MCDNSVYSPHEIPHKICGCFLCRGAINREGVCFSGAKLYGIPYFSEENGFILFCDFSA